MKKLLATTLTTSALLLGGCNDLFTQASVGLTENEPVSVARNFWNVHFAQGGDPSELTMFPERFKSRFEQNNVNPRITLGTTQEANSMYFIQSNFTYGHAGATSSIPFTTVVGSKSGKFRVDYDATMNSFYDTIVTQKIDELQTLLDETSKHIKHGIPNHNATIANDSYVWANEMLHQTLAKHKIKQAPKPKR